MWKLNSNCLHLQFASIKQCIAFHLVIRNQCSELQWRIAAKSADINYKPLFNGPLLISIEICLWVFLHLQVVQRATRRTRYDGEPIFFIFVLYGQKITSHCWQLSATREISEKRERVLWKTKLVVGDYKQAHLDWTLFLGWLDLSYGCWYMLLLLWSKLQLLFNVRP